MELFISQLLHGLVYSMLLFLLAAGLSLIFGLMSFVNLAHGSLYMLGAFIGLTAYLKLGSFWLALIVAPAAVAAISVVAERTILRRVFDRGHLDQVLLTFGLIYVISDVVRIIWGADVFSMPPPELLQDSVSLLGGAFPSYRLFVIVLGLLVAALLWLGVERSRIGAMVRAAVDDAFTASGIGINVPRLFTGVFAFGSALAGLSGVAASPIVGVYYGMDSEILIPAFIVIVIGGMGTLRGAFFGSLIVGQIETLGKAYLPDYSLFLTYALMVLVLTIRPSGLFGIKLLPREAHPTGSTVDTGRFPAWLRGGGFLVMGCLLIMPLFLGNYGVGLATEILIIAIFAMSLDLVLGYTGLPSFGHATFFGVAAYVVIVLSTMFGLNVWVAVAIAVVASALLAFVIGVVSVRLHGVAFLMITMAASQLVFSVALRWRSVTGGNDGVGGLDRPSIAGISLFDPATMYAFVVLTFIASYAVLRRLINSQLGHVFVGIRENEDRMRAIGYPVQRYKVLSMGIGGAFAGVSGALYALLNGFVSTDVLHWGFSGDVLVMVIVGGIGTLLGPAVGAALVLLAKYLISSYVETWQLLVGVIFILCVLGLRSGIYGSLLNVLARHWAADRSRVSLPGTAPAVDTVNR